MATISEDYVSFEIAKLLKEKGFLKGIDLKMTQNLSFYDNIGLTHNLNKYYDRLIQDKIDFVVAPTLQMAMKWLREVHNIVIGVNVLNENNKGNTDYSNPDRWWYFWEFTDTKGVYKEELQPDALSNEYSTYEEAAEAAIKYCLENLI